jgi:phytoene desaturase
VPNLDGNVDWAAERGPMRGELAARVAGLGYPSEVVVDELVDPVGWERQGLAKGTPFSLSHRFLQTGPFRPSNVERRAPGVVFTGSATVPGVGVPMVLVSGRLAAARVAELDRAR